MCCIPVLLTFSAASTWVQTTNSGSHLMGLQNAHFPCSRQRLFKMLLLCLKFPVCFISIRIQPLSKAYRVLCDGVPLPHLTSFLVLCLLLAHMLRPPCSCPKLPSIFPSWAFALAVPHCLQQWRCCHGLLPYITGMSGHISHQRRPSWWPYQRSRLHHYPS